MSWESADVQVNFAEKLWRGAVRAVVPMARPVGTDDQVVALAPDAAELPVREDEHGAVAVHVLGTTRRDQVVGLRVTGCLVLDRARGIELDADVIANARSRSADPTHVGIGEIYGVHSIVPLVFRLVSPVQPASKPTLSGPESANTQLCCAVRCPSRCRHRRVGTPEPDFVRLEFLLVQPLVNPAILLTTPWRPPHHPAQLADQSDPRPPAPTPRRQLPVVPLKVSQAARNVLHALRENRPCQLPGLSVDVTRPVLASAVSRPRHKPQVGLHLL